MKEGEGSSGSQGEALVQTMSKMVSRLNVESQLLLFMSVLMRRRGRTRPNEGLVRSEAEAQRRRRFRMLQQQSQRQILMLLLLRTRELNHSHSLTSPKYCAFLKDLGSSDWLERFRMSKDTFVYLCDHLRSRLNRPGLAPEEKVAIALWILACPGQYSLMQTKFSVRRRIMFKCLKEVCQAMVTVLKPMYLHPPDHHGLCDKARIFNSRWGFPHCVGALGTLHIPLPIDSKRNGEDSLVLHTVVDGQGLLWDACAIFPESMNSSAILENSIIWDLVQEGRLQRAPEDTFLSEARNYFLLGDASYPLQDWLLTPYPNDSRQSQVRFNLRLERARSVSEIALLRLRARWQYLLAPPDCTFLPTLVLACCVLHNICETHEQSFDSHWLEGVDTGDTPSTPSYLYSLIPVDSHAERLRNAVCRYFDNEGNNYIR
uniref:DDE Tnp4 domain-containing protein n=1 Tax=Leptobrachium leishanense TaxID=445787 RepID=A0A8C5LSG9_9ANUR